MAFMDSFKALLDHLGPLEPIAAALNVSVQAVSNMKARKAVSPDHWPKLLSFCVEKGVEGVSFETLSLWYSQRPGASPRAARAAA